MTTTSTVTSLYIPVFPNEFTLFDTACTKENITMFFEKTLCLGKVNRIDLASRVSGGGPSVFVHFSEWTKEGLTFCQHLENLEKSNTGYKWSGYPINNPSQKNKKLLPYVVIKINKKPIPTFTIPIEELNVHQLQHAIVTMEASLKEKLQIIEDQAKQLEELNIKIQELTAQQQI